MAAQFEKAVVTDEGRSLIAGSEGTATALEFTGMATGAGIYTPEQATYAELKVKTALKDPIQLFPISGLRKYNTETALIKSILSNEELEEPYNWNEVGIYARLKGSGLDPILFAIAVVLNDGGTEIPAASPSTLMTVSQSFYLKTNGASPVTIEVNHDVCALLEDVGINIDLETDDTTTLVAATNEVNALAKELQWMNTHNRYYAAIADDDGTLIVDDDDTVILGDWKYQIV